MYACALPLSSRPITCSPHTHNTQHTPRARVLHGQAKEKKEKDAERAQKAEEVKEKKENLEKRLQKMPQIYMSPTARSLVENIISSLRSGQPPVTVQSRPVDSDLADDDSGFDPREAEEEIDLGWDCEEEEDVDRAAAKAEEAKAKRMAEKALRRRLKQLGWRKEDVDRVLAALPERDLPPTDDLNKRVKKVLDWLLLHVAEEHLPVEYQPAKTLEIGITAFPSAKQPKSTLPHLGMRVWVCACKRAWAHGGECRRRGTGAGAVAGG